MRKILYSLADRVTIWPTHIAWCINKATPTTKYVIFIVFYRYNYCKTSPQRYVLRTLSVLSNFLVP